MLLQNNENIELTQAIIAALLGGTGVALLRLIDNWVSTKISNKDSREDRLYREATQLRKELRLEVEKLESTITNLQSALDDWKTRYWKLYQEYLLLSAEIEDDIEETKRIKQEIKTIGQEKLDSDVSR